MSNTNQNLPSDQKRSHLTPFLEGPRGYLVLLRNSLLVVGVYLLGWSTNLAVFQIWFDGITALGAMLAFQMLAFVKHDKKTFEPPPGVPPEMLLRLFVLIWLIILLLLGIPYWFMMLFFSLNVFEEGFWSLLFGNFGVIAVLLFVLASNIIEESKRGYDRMSDTQIRLEFNWEFNMHLARITAILLVSFVLRFELMIVVLAIVLSYVEIYPMRTLRFFGGDRTLEAGNENRSRD